MDQAEGPCFSESHRLREKGHALIPGGGHTYSKGDDQFPEDAPSYIARGKGCHVWDVDGNEFIEFGMGLRAVTLGHAYEPVVQAASRQMLLGANYTRPGRIEIEAAEDFLGVIPGAEMVKFAKNGSDATTAAVKLARAYTGRSLVAICADQPFFSVDDWFIGTLEMDAGIPKAIRDLTVSFRYNDLESVRQVFDDHPGQIACLIMEAATVDEPRDGFLQSVKDLCEAHGALLIFDEMITGFRWDVGGAQQCYRVVPHLSTFGKALGNGFAISALAGQREFMELGGLRHERERVFLMSTTHGAETHALAAAQATIRTYRECGVIDHLYRQGARLRAGIERSILSHRVSGHFEVLGRPCNLIYTTKDEKGQRSQAFRTLFMEQLVRRGVLAPSLVVSFSHTDDDIDRTIGAIDEALLVYRRALEEGIEKYLCGRPVKPVNRRFN